MRGPKAADPAAAGAPASLRDPGLHAVWRAVRLRLDRDGETAPRTMAMPHFEVRCSPILAAVLERPPTKRLDLRALEAGLRRLGIGPNLNSALARLGFPPDQATVERRTARLRSSRARQALAEGVASWPEPWAPEWSEELRRAGLIGGLDADDVAALLDSVRRFVDLFGRPAREPPDGSPPGRRQQAQRALTGEASTDRVSESGDQTLLRTEVAAQLFGSAHALDDGTRLGAAAERALRFLVGAAQDAPQGKALWSAAGISTDSVSAPVLTWGLRPVGMSPLDRMLHAAAEGGLPVHVSVRSLREHPIAVPGGTPVLVAENPSVMEAAMAAPVPFGLVCANGNPSAAVTELVTQLMSSGASLGYHGDFDATGISICRRMAQRGCEPWMMRATDYLAALERAEADGVKLLSDPKHCGATPWDPRLEPEFGHHRLIVHEEAVINDVLPAFAEHVHASSPWQVVDTGRSHSPASCGRQTPRTPG